MSEEHKLEITCDRDAQARCSCGRWTYTSPGPINRTRVQQQWELHTALPEPAWREISKEGLPGAL